MTKAAEMREVCRQALGYAVDEIVLLRIALMLAKGSTTEQPRQFAARGRFRSGSDAAGFQA